MEDEREDAAAMALLQWEQSFRDDAKADDYLLLQTHLQSLDLPDDPDLLLEGTILLVQMCAAYLTLDNQSLGLFLAQQTYDPDRAIGAPYTVTFDLCRKAYARLNLPASLRPVDLADLYGSPWNEYEVVGYCDLWIARADGNELSTEEMAAFEKAVDYDLRFDYGEDEVRFWFDPDTHAGILKVTVQDVYEGEDELLGSEEEEEEEEDEKPGKDAP